MNKNLDNTRLSMNITESSYNVLDATQNNNMSIIYDKFLIDFLKSYELDYKIGIPIFNDRFIPLVTSSTSQCFQLSYNLAINGELINDKLDNDVLDIITIEKESSTDFYIVNFPRNISLINDIIAYAFYLISIEFGIYIIGDIYYNTLENSILHSKKHHYIDSNKIREYFNIEVKTKLKLKKPTINSSNSSSIKFELSNKNYEVEAEKIFEIEDSFEYVSLLSFAMLHFTDYLLYLDNFNVNDNIKSYIKHYEDLINRDGTFYQGTAYINGDILLDFIIIDDIVNILTIIPDEGFANIIIALIREINYCVKSTINKIIYMTNKVIEINHSVTITDKED